jgi:Mg-chelatase subunit ChlD
MWGPAAGPYVRIMLNSTLLPTPKASAPAAAVALRDVRKVHGRGEGAVVVLLADGRVAGALDAPTAGEVAEHLARLGGC